MTDFLSRDLVDAPHFLSPFQFNSDGSVGVCSQGDSNNLQSQVRDVLQCQQGEAYFSQTFGAPPILFQVEPFDTTALVDSVQQQVSGVSLATVQNVLQEEQNPGTVNIGVEITPNNSNPAA